MLDITTRDGACHIRIDAELSIYHAAEYKPRLLAAIAQHPHTEINLAEVSELDCAGVQLLLLAKREALRRGHHLALVAHSHASQAAIDLLGLAGYFGDPLILEDARGSA